MVDLRLNQHNGIFILFICMKKLLNLQIPEHSYLIGFVQTDGHLQKNKGNKGKLTIEISHQFEDVIWNANFDSMSDSDNQMIITDLRKLNSFSNVD